MRRLVVLFALGVLAAFSFAGGAEAATTTEFPVIVADSGPFGIAAGSDGNLWFTELDGSRVGRITTTGVVRDWSTGSGISTNSRPWGIAAGPDGNLWFTEESGNRVARITTGAASAPKATEFSAGISADAAPRGIAAGPDGNLWFAEDAGRIGRITTAGAVTEFSAGITRGARPLGIAAGPDGNLWFTEQADRIGRITPAGAVTEFSEGITAGSLPGEIVAGPDGNLWFTEFGGDRIGQITPAGRVTEFSAGISAGAEPRGIAVGPDGNLWFAEEGLDQVARITPAGAVTEYHAGITAKAEPLLIALGSDGNLWFTEGTGNSIARVRLEPAVTTGAATSIASSAATLEGTVNRFGLSASFAFQFGRTTAYGSVTPSAMVPAAAGAVPVSARVGGLEPGTRYHYRLVATSAGGTSFGADRTFMTTGTGTGTGGGSGGASGGGDSGGGMAGSPPADRTGPRLTLLTRSLTLTRAGRVRISLHCPVAETLGCHGTLQLQTAGAHRSRLGRAGFRIGGGQTRTSALRVSGRGRALAHAHRRVVVRAVVTAFDAAGNRRTTVKRLRLRAA